RQIQTGGKDPLVSEDNDKPTVLALREIAQDLVNASILIDTAQEEAQASVAALDSAESAVTEEGALITPKNDISIEDAMDAELVPEETEEPGNSGDIDGDSEEQQ
ncbi:MAG: DNA-directed RNA polymerase subunit omega, partial [Alphaproteobacteria bacterium]|nr:DNA-directed RNA polymerase subunit omega [Alphaproteobacteria bacterium]